MGTIVPSRKLFFEHREEENRRKINKLGDESPKMYYTPDEFPVPKETETSKLTFRNLNVISPMSVSLDDGLPDMEAITMYKKTYEKVHFKNSKYEYLLVDTDQIEKFNEMFLNKTKDKTWI